MLRAVRKYVCILVQYSSPRTYQPEYRIEALVLLHIRCSCSTQASLLGNAQGSARGLYRKVGCNVNGHPSSNYRRSLPRAGSGV